MIAGVAFCGLFFGLFVFMIVLARRASAHLSGGDGGRRGHWDDASSPGGDLYPPVPFQTSADSSTDSLSSHSHDSGVNSSHDCSCDSSCGCDSGGGGGSCGCD